MKDKISTIVITAIVVALITWYANYKFYSNLSEEYEDSKIRIENLETSLNSKVEEIKQKDAEIEKLNSSIEEKNLEIDGLKQKETGDDVLINIDK